MAGERAVIVIPAHNEEMWVGETIHAIRRAGFHSLIIVVDDGSTDHTSERARAAGAVVLRMRRNVGKGHAFLRGVRYALVTGPVAIIAMDADTITLPRTALRELTANALRATRKKEVRTFIAAQSAGSGIIPMDLSGFRSFSLPAAIYLSRARGKKIARGFGMEPFLNSIFRDHTTYLKNTPITTRLAESVPAHAAGFQRDWNRMVRGGLRRLGRKMAQRKRRSTR